MNKTSKELIFLLTVLVISILCSFIPGIKFKFVSSINPLEIEDVIDISNIEKNQSSSLNNADLIFKGGFCYTGNDVSLHSDFYEGNITKIATSTYWKHPIYNNESKLYLKGTKKGFIAQLVIPFKINLPIVSVIVNPDDFFDEQNGIYIKGDEANYTASKTFYPMPWNQPANYYRKIDDKKKCLFSFYNEKGEAKYFTYSMIDISGKATRCLPQKSLKLKSSKVLGDKEFKYDFFQENKVYESLVLRNGGNDNSKTLFRDMLMQNLLSSTNLLISNFMPCEVFLNGEYWGIHFLQNKLDQDFIAQKMSCKKKNVSIVENFKLDKGSEFEYESLISVISNLNMKNIEEEIDLDDLINYLAGQIIFGNTDWPSNNLKMYKVSGTKSSNTKWRFAFFDLDYGFGYTGTEASSFDMFEYLIGKKDSFSKLFQFLLKDKSFRSKLKFRMLSLLNNELSNSKMIERIIENKELLLPAIGRHIDRWRKPVDFNEWLNNIDDLILFANQRNANIINQIKKHLN